MKDYHEMTQSVLQQAKARAAQRSRQRRMATGLIAAALCLVILISVVSVGINRNPADATHPTISMENPTTAPTTLPGITEPIVPPAEMKVYFLSGNTDQLSQQYMLEGMTIPAGGQIRVRRLNGLSEEERRQAIREEKDIYDAYFYIVDENGDEITDEDKALDIYKADPTKLFKKMELHNIKTSIKVI